jgi:hypothetical protein
MNFVCHFVAVLLSVSALQFTHVTNTISAGGMTYSLAPYGVDFTVYAAIVVFALGMFDADERGFM